MSNDALIFIILSAVALVIIALADGTCVGTSFCSPFSLEQSLKW
ncbi:MAG: hypothetical protein AAFS07_16840 [Pseudomonadota bacterium]